MGTGGVSLYYSIKNDVYKQIDNNLIIEKEIIQDQIDQTDTIPDFAATFGHLIEVKLLNSITSSLQVIKDTDIYDNISFTVQPFRYLYFLGSTPANKGYSIKILQVLTEKQELLGHINLYLFFLFLSLLLISIAVNYLISRKIWGPFYKSVDEAAGFDVLSDKQLNLPETDILEFDQLNKVFEKMTHKMRSDYLNLKEYNENAAHEIQTPLAIIRSKMELLMQNENLKRDSLEHIKSINDATTRLLKLNQGLLLISKIENQYFHETKKVSIRDLIEIGFSNYKEILELKGIRVELEASDPAFVEINEVLADVLISNLISNAVRYNINNGFIKCQIGHGCLGIINSGIPLTGDPELVFRRFHKTNDNPQSVGLGLSIVKKITDNYKMNICYKYSHNMHEVQLEYLIKQSN